MVKIKKMFNGLMVLFLLIPLFPSADDIVKVDFNDINWDYKAPESVVSDLDSEAVFTKSSSSVSEDSSSVLPAGKFFPVEFVHFPGSVSWFMPIDLVSTYIYSFKFSSFKTGYNPLFRVISSSLSPADFGVYTSGDPNYLHFFGNSFGTISDLGGNPLSLFSSSSYRFANSSFKDATSVSGNYGPFCLGGFNAYNGSCSSGFVGDVYYFEVYDGSDIILDLKPVMRVDGVYGLYDYVSGSFYSSSSLTGPIVDSDPYTVRVFSSILEAVQSFAGTDYFSQVVYLLLASACLILLLSLFKAV